MNAIVAWRRSNALYRLAAFAAALLLLRVFLGILLEYRWYFPACPYGVWGALGTAAGANTALLD